MQASTSDNPVRQAISGLASGIYKATASFQTVDSSLSPLWQGLKKLNMGEVQAALRNGADPNETNTQGEPTWPLIGVLDTALGCPADSNKAQQQGTALCIAGALFVQFHFWSIPLQTRATSEFTALAAESTILTDLPEVTAPDCLHLQRRCEPVVRATESCDCCAARLQVTPHCCTLRARVSGLSRLLGRSFTVSPCRSFS